ncbi:MAG: hypothetical protein WEB13_07600 [Dehalococcoidia bacterium]
MGARYRVRRLEQNPIIVPHMDERMGANINGPTLLRVPEWVSDPLGRYYLYFSHHNGTYIRLAIADAIEGPWRMHEPGTLQHADSYFPPELEPLDPAALPTGMVPPLPHIASPDVHVDHAAGQVRMYYHGILANRRQVTRVALSADGLRFAAREEILGPSYFRVFRHGGWWYALAMPGVFLRSRDGLTGFERGPTLFTHDMRHSAVFVDGDTLTVFYTVVGEAPERVVVSAIDLSGDWLSWREGPAEPVLEPEREYEGVDLPLVPSIRGEITQRARQLRDPAVYREEGRTYLLYAVAGESGIAIAELSEQ